jgi:hypothetical protein
LPRSVCLALVIFGLAFAPRLQGQAPDFTIIVLPDTQYYSETYPQILNSQTQWIVNNAAALDIQLVLGAGDIVNAGSTPAEWNNADAAYKLLDGAHIPYFAAIGNHDYESSNPAARLATNFNAYFGPARYGASGYWKGSYPSGSNENFYGTLTINGQTYLVLALEFYPRDSALSWAAQVVQNAPGAQVIVVTHAYEYFDNTRVSSCNSFDAQYYGMAADNDGDAIWAKLVRQYSNITMVLSGHEIRGPGQDATGRRIDLGVHGNLVNQILSNYQNMANGGDGYLRIMKFHPSTDTIDVLTYSPYLNSYLSDAGNQFTTPWHNWTGTGTGTINGLVADISTCSPLPATITLPAGNTAANASGAFSLSGLAPGSYSLVASDSGYTPAGRNVEVGPGLTASAKLFLGTGSGQLTGTVKDSSGAAIAGATVQMTGSASASASDITITSDRNGNYNSGSIPGGTYQSTASAPGFNSGSSNISIPTGATATKNFVLTASPVPHTPPPVTISSVAPATGSTSGGTSVTITGSNFAAGASVMFGNAPAQVASVTANSIAAVAPSGPAGGVTVAVTNPNGGGNASLANGFTYTAPTGSNTGNLTGQVLKDDTLVPLSGASVTYGGRTATTNANGVFSLSNVPVGSGTAAASDSGYQTVAKNATVSNGATSTINFSLQPNCAISGVNPSVTICLPTTNSTVLSPVHIVAKSTDTHVVSNVQVWVDGVKVYQISGGALNTNVAMSKGVTHRLTVESVDAANQIFKQTIYVTVQ